MEEEELSQTILKTLNAISFYRRLNLHQISRATGTDLKVVIKHVKALKQMGLVREIDEEYESKIVPTFNRINARFLKKHR